MSRSYVSRGVCYPAWFSTLSSFLMCEIAALPHEADRLDKDKAGLAIVFVFTKRYNVAKVPFTFPRAQSMWCIHFDSQLGHDR